MTILLAVIGISVFFGCYIFALDSVDDADTSGFIITCGWVVAIVCGAPAFIAHAP